MAEALIGFALLFGLLLLRVPIAFSLLLVGVVGFALSRNATAALRMSVNTVLDTSFSYTLSVVPMFMLMGSLVSRAGISDQLYDAANALVGRRRGGIAMATILSCGGFSAICGSSLATVASMSRVAMPSMRRYGYADHLAAGAIAAGGTLGILIPPSIILVIFGMLTQQDIGRLFAAGILPGLLGIALYLVAVRLVIWRSPEAGPRGPAMAWRDRLAAMTGAGSVLALVVLVLGGIYGGLFTPTEAAGVGAFGALVIGLVRRRLSARSILEALRESIATSAMLFFLAFGALVFNNFINIVGFTRALEQVVTGTGLSPWMILLVIMLIYLVLGCMLESLSMILLTVPVFYPIVAVLDFGPGVPPELKLIWFGILVVVATEISLITPPIGLNVFVLRQVIGDVRLATIFRGVTPFWIADLVRLALLLLLPSIALWLPGRM